MRDRNLKIPRVYISYTYDSVEHVGRVQELAEHLRADGVDIISDQSPAVPSDNWESWIKEQISQSQFVLMICTKCYYAWVMGLKELDLAEDPQWPGSLILSYINEPNTDKSKFIPVLFSHHDVKYIPDPLRLSIYYPIHWEFGYEVLVKRLTNQPLEASGLSRLNLQIGPGCAKNAVVSPEESHCTVPTPLAGLKTRK